MKNIYKVYGKKLQNNIGDEYEQVGHYEANSKEEAVNKALDDYGNIDGFEKVKLFAVNWRSV